MKQLKKHNHIVPLILPNKGKLLLTKDQDLNQHMSQCCPSNPRLSSEAHWSSSECDGKANHVMTGSDDRHSEGYILRRGLQGPAFSITGCRMTDSLLYSFSHLPADEHTGGSQWASLCLYSVPHARAFRQLYGMYRLVQTPRQTETLTRTNKPDQVLLIMQLSDCYIGFFILILFFFHSNRLFQKTKITPTYTSYVRIK